MKKISCILFVFLVIGVQSIFAQVPGYQGKRFSVGYNASSFFYFSHFTMEDGLEGVFGSTRLSYKTEVYANYAVSRKTSIGFSYYTAKQKDYFKGAYMQGYNYVIPVDEFVLSKINIFELHFQFFKKNFVAPVGLYNQLGIAIVKYDLGNPGDSVALSSSDGYNYISALNGPIDPFTCCKLSYHVGKINPVGHHFFINTAFGINLFVAGGSEGIFFNQHTNNFVSNNYIKANLNRGLNSHDLLEIKIGLGWLAF